MCRLSDHMCRAGFLFLGLVAEADNCLPQYPHHPNWRNDISQPPLSAGQCVISRSDMWQLPGNLFVGQLSSTISSLHNSPFLLSVV